MSGALAVAGEKEGVDGTAASKALEVAAHTDKEHTDKEHTDKEHTDKEHTDKEHTDKEHTDKGIDGNGMSAHCPPPDPR